MDDKKKVIKKTISWIVYIAILIGLIYGLPKGLAYLLETEYPMASITSGSMWPALKRGDLIFIKGIDGKEEIQMGDIVVYRNPQGFTIHRVVKLNEETAVTKGDANNVSDAPIEYKEIVGKALTFNQKPIRIPLLGNISVLINRNKI